MVDFSKCNNAQHTQNKSALHLLTVKWIGFCYRSNLLLREEMACPSWVYLFLILPEHCCPCHWCLWLFLWGFWKAAFESFLLWKALYKSIWSELNVSLHHTLLWLCAAATGSTSIFYHCKKKDPRLQVIYPVFWTYHTLPDTHLLIIEIKAVLRKNNR